MTQVYIVAAKRTPFGRFMGGLAKCSAVDLAVAAGKAVLQDIDPAVIDQLIVGNVLSAGLGMNVARQVGVRVGVPQDRPAMTVNMVCGSGLCAVSLAAQSIRAGESQVVLCGGTESMSNAPYLLDRVRQGYRLGDGLLIDSVLRDGLTDAFDRQHMGVTAERLAEQHAITRGVQDEFALASQTRYAAAAKSGRLAGQIVPVLDLVADEHPRSDVTAQKLASLKPVFGDAGSVTAGNSSGINDGAAMLVLCGHEALSRHGWRPMAVVRGWAAVGCDPKLMGLGPIFATRRLCQRFSLALESFDTIELNEAFAAQALACMHELRLDHQRVNRDGGAIALGHPIGASGARLAVHLAHQLRDTGLRRGLATLCVGGGLGVAIALDACH